MARGRRNSPVIWRYRPKGQYAAARMAWNAHRASYPGHHCEIVTLQLLDGQWHAKFADGAVRDISQDELKGWARDQRNAKLEADTLPEGRIAVSSHAD
jgi:hypothetical protein